MTKDSRFAQTVFNQIKSFMAKLYEKTDFIKVKPAIRKRKFKRQCLGAFVQIK